MIADLVKDIPVISALVSLLAIVGGGVFSFVRWLDVRKRELRQQRWSDYTALLAQVSGEAKIPVQLAALYQLPEFREFSHITIAALTGANDIEKKLNNVQWTAYLAPQIESVISTLRNSS